MRRQFRGNVYPRMLVGNFNAMVNQTADLQPDAWAKAAERLNSVGVFADERRQFPSSPNLQQFDEKMRANGYSGGVLEVGDLENPKDGVSLVIFDKSKFTHAAEAVSAWDQEYQTRWHQRVQYRVSDWLSRLDNLSALIKSWLPSSMSIISRSPVMLREELMVKFGVPSANMPSFDIFEGNTRIMRVQPKGLWIIGANGRVDLITPKSSYIVVDKSSPEESESSWHFYSPDNKRKSTALDESSFRRLLTQ